MEVVERRQVERLRCVLGVGDLNGQSCPDTFLTDISSLGAQLETGRSFAIGEAVEVGLTLPAAIPAENDPYRFRGRVMWIKAAEAPPGRYRIGLSFFAPLSEATTILANFRYRYV